MEDSQLPPSMKLLGTTVCQCKTTATQTVPASDEEDEGGCVEMEIRDMAEATETPLGSNRRNSNRKKGHQFSTQSSSGRIDSIFDGGTDSSATAAQIVGIDQWSSSGTDSTTGVIIRSGATGEWANELEVKPTPEPSIIQPPQEEGARRVDKSENVILVHLFMFIYLIAISS